MSEGFVDLTPGMQMAMLELRATPFAKEVLRFLMAHSTARMTGADLHALDRLSLARYEGGQYFLTPRGMWRANEVARALAQSLGIKPPAVVTFKHRSQGRYGRYSKGTHHPW